MSENLAISRIRKKQNEAVAKRTQLYERLYDQAIRTINMYAASGATSCIHCVPMFVFGEPKYDIGECCAFIVGRLQASGELRGCEHRPPNQIACRWDF